MGTVVTDADVLIGFLDPADAQHARAVETLRPWLIAEHKVLLPASVYAEILVHPMRRGVDDTIDDFLSKGGIEVVPVDRAIARQAAGLRAQHAALRLPDALALATARQHAASFLTLDERLRRLAAGST